MKVAVPGVGLMGSQIGVEYAVGGHDVTFVARDPATAWHRIDRAFALLVDSGLAAETQAAEARGRIAVAIEIADIGADCDLVVENVAEDLALKGEVLGKAGRIAPDAVLASNTSSIPITAIGDACGFPDRVIGTHYWNPPLLMPLVEIIRSERTRPGLEAPVVAALRAMGKRTVVAQKDVPGFVWNRMQFALLREAVWLVENGVASAEDVDLIVRDGLARRWRYTGPFQTATLGGGATFQRIANNLWPVISAETGIDGLQELLPGTPDDLAHVRERRDRGLVRDLLQDREEGGR